MSDDASPTESRTTRGNRLKLAVLTTGRQDYGILRSSLMLLRDDPRFDLRVWVGGMHLRPEYGNTVSAVEADGMPIGERIDFLRDQHTVGAQSAAAMAQFCQCFERQSPDALLLLGDRSETCVAGVASTLMGVPLVHIHGGEETEGAVDNALRHALTKLSHLHLVTHTTHAQRVLQMGESPESVVVVGAPGLDNLYRDDLPSRTQLAAWLGHPLTGPLWLVTMHPATLGSDPAQEMRAVTEAMARVSLSHGGTFVVTMPNADNGGAVIRQAWQKWAVGRSNVLLRDALGEKNYWALLRIVDGVLGNSSSGIIEAPAAGRPVVDVGDRQKGRLRSDHVRAVPAEPDQIEAVMRECLTPSRARECLALEGVYPSGPAAPKIVEAIAQWQVPRPPRKAFVSLR
jgi:UDP-N-acetylglucosamine 2-epimerase (non-hydrolysing)/GDP/UDP-N,N'-diacetylbacillosamine 2-epimerase (hydrolysing)